MVLLVRNHLGNHAGLPCSIPVGNASSVVTAGYNDGSPFGVIAEVHPSALTFFMEEGELVELCHTLLNMINM
eukprot:2771978-Ditylum_brightwellii.AAC.1